MRDSENRFAIAPGHRMRRLRRTPGLRALVQETGLGARRLLYPVFVTAGHDVVEPIGSMPGQFRFSPDRLGPVAEEAASSGVAGLLLFGLPKVKDSAGSQALLDDGVVQQSLRAARSAAPDLVLVTDVCLCAYTSHGHCGVLRGSDVDNDATLPLLAEMAVSHARAGADIVAPSAMMDGQVAAIREALDGTGQDQCAIMAYSAKFASAFYGPFREAAGSAPQLGDRRGYQMDPPNLREALREIEADEAQGADIVMVKPGFAYLDVLRAAREATRLPLAVYNVSGEYAMLKAAGEKGWICERDAALELLTAFRRAGADIVITYHALEAARWLRE